MSGYGRCACTEPDRCQEYVRACTCAPAHTQALCHPYYREEACSLVIGLFRSQEGAPSSEEETHVLSRCLLLAGTRLRRDETTSLHVCLCARVCERESVCVHVGVHKGVWDKGAALEQKRLAVPDLFKLWSLFPLSVSTRMPPCVHWPGCQFWAPSVICPSRLTLKKKISKNKA